MKLRLFATVVFAITLGSASVATAQTTHNSVTLTWTTPGDDSLTGTASQFDLRYSTSPITAANFGSATRWTSMPAPAASGTTQNVTVTGLTPATTYHFMIKTADEVPNWSGISNLLTRTTLAAPDVSRPAPVAALTITGTTDSTATLGWIAVGDDSLTGTAATYDIRYSTSPITAANFASATQVANEPAPAAPGTSQNYVVRGLSRQVTYHFAIKTADEVPNWSAISNVPSAITPDTMRPAAITNLTASFVWLTWSSARAIEPRVLEVARR
jgi:phosphodiesterase/alkaline phosphatase D-like protein